MAEITESLIQFGRSSLRLSTSSRDDEIEQTIGACLLDMVNGGVKVIDTSDPLIKQAIKLYLKAQFGYDEDAVKFSVAYENLKCSIALSGLYNKEKSND